MNKESGGVDIRVEQAELHQITMTASSQTGVMVTVADERTGAKFFR